MLKLNTNLNSTLIAFVEWLESDTNPYIGTLVVAFRKGTTYQYTDVPYSVYEALITADSAGLMFSAIVRGKYSYTKID